MNTLSLSNQGISRYLKELNSFTEPVRIGRQDKLWLSLILEEILLNAKEVFGEDKEFSYVLKKRFGNLLCEIKVDGPEYDILHINPDDEDTAMLDTMLSAENGDVLFTYRKNANIVSITIPLQPVKLKLPGSPMMHTMVLAMAVSMLLRLLLPDTVRTALCDGYISPVYSVLTDMLKGVIGPVVFTSLVVSIFTLDDLTTLKTLGKRIMLTFLLCIVVMFALAVITCYLVFPLKGDSGTAFSPKDLLSLLLSSIPTNILTPFTEGNMIHIVILGCVSGIVLLLLGEKSDSIRKLFLEAKYFFYSMLRIVSRLLPFLVFLGVIIKAGLTMPLPDSSAVITLIVLDLALELVVVAGILIFTSVRFKVGLILLVKKVMPVARLGFATGSGSTSIFESYECLKESLGVSERFTNCWMSMSQSFFSVSTIFALVIYTFYSTSMQNAAMPAGRLLILFVLVLLLSMATPSIPGGIIASLTVMFAQLGLSMDQLGIIMGANVIILYFDVAAASFIRLLLAVHAAAKEGALDVDVLRAE